SSASSKRFSEVLRQTRSSRSTNKVVGDIGGFSDEMRQRQFSAASPPTTACVQHSERLYLSSLMSHAQEVQYWIWLAILLVTLAYFWIWWLRPEHNIGTFSYILNLIVIAWLTLLPLYFIFILPHARVPAQRAVPVGYRVAMVVTKASCEPFPIVRETL